MDIDEEDRNFRILRECLSGPMIEELTAKPTKPNRRKSSKSRNNSSIKAAASGRRDDPNSTEDLSEFIDVLWAPVLVSKAAGS